VRVLALGIVVAAFVGCAGPSAPHADGAVVIASSLAESSAGSGPRFAADGPDAEEYGAREGYPVKIINRAPFFVGAFSHHDQIFEGRIVRRAAMPSRLDRASAEPPLRYEYGVKTLTLDDYLTHNPTTGLLIARGDTILVERYQYARNDRHRFASFSMAKTVTAMLIGVAIAEGHIRSVDDLAAAYVLALADTEYGRTSLRHLLQMSSGVQFSEKYSGRDDVARLFVETVFQEGAGGVEAVKPYNERGWPSGTIFSYASVETQVLGLVLRGAVGRPVADYLHEKIWEPIGAEADATWLVDRSGQEATYCCLNAVLRDYVRLGLLLAHDGNWRGRQLIPVAWINDATRVRDDQPHLRPGTARRYLGYGYQVWLLPGERRMFALLGAHGRRSRRSVQPPRHGAHCRFKVPDPTEHAVAWCRGRAGADSRCTTIVAGGWSARRWLILRARGPAHSSSIASTRAGPPTRARASSRRGPARAARCCSNWACARATSTRPCSAISRRMAGATRAMRGAATCAWR
jgi:CubicO group peptidase (beta-lactamase class C family)